MAGNGLMLREYVNIWRCGCGIGSGFVQLVESLLLCLDFWGVRQKQLR